MIMSFASPLGIGLTSDGEYFDIELTEAIDSKTAVKRMNEVSIEGIEIISFRKIPDDKKQTGMTILAGADYLVSVRKGALPSDWKEQFSKFMSQPEIQVIKQTKRSERTDLSSSCSGKFGKFKTGSCDGNIFKICKYFR